jgi:hypothetical protein
MQIKSAVLYFYGPYVQHESPGPDVAPNWLPVPAGKFNLTFRAYQPDAAILDFSYHAPPAVRV